MAGARHRLRLATVVLVGLVVAFALAAFASPFASTQPDGLNKVAAEHEFDATARDSATADSPLAGYSATSVDNQRAAKGFAGVIGVGFTLVAALVLFGVLWRLVRQRPGPPATAAGGA